MYGPLNFDVIFVRLGNMTSGRPESRFCSRLTSHTFFCLAYGSITGIEFSQVLSVFSNGEIRATGMMYFMITVRLLISVYVMLFHHLCLFACSKVRAFLHRALRKTVIRHFCQKLFFYIRPKSLHSTIISILFFASRVSRRSFRRFSMALRLSGLMPFSLK